MRKARGRKKDDHWDYFTKQKDNGKWKCNWCGHELSGKTSITTIKAHLYRAGRIGFCRRNRGDHNNMPSGSRNPQDQVAEGAPVPVPERIHAITSTSINRQDNIDCGGMDRSSYIQSSSDGDITYLNKLVSDLESQKSDMEGQVQLLPGKKRKRSVNSWFDNTEKLRTRAIELNKLVHLQPGTYGGEIRQLIEEIEKHKERVPLVLSAEFVGESFEENMKKVWKLLSDDEVFTIGIHGMGGVGKTLLASHLESELKRKGSFNEVFWVTVSHGCSISKLQHDIARRMGVQLCEGDEKIKAESLSSALKKKEKTVLIFDDVWRSINLAEVGIPHNLKGIKVIVTTRLKHVCESMDCKMIEMETLESPEASELFRVKLGQRGTPAVLPWEVEDIAACVVDRCGGLPLAISVMARTLKGSINDVHRWKTILNKLDKWETEHEVGEEVCKVLQRSYDNLMETDLQSCFLYCALLHCFNRHELIVKLVDFGLFEGRESLEVIFDEGNAALTRLKKCSLLKEDEDEDLRMYVSPFLTHMALNVLKNSQKCVMVKFVEAIDYFKKELTIMKWKDLEFLNLVICSDEAISEIPEGMSPHCPRLSTLIIGPYGIHDGIGFLPECFFRNMNALTVLDLSRNSGLESLPESLSDLTSLVSLTLYGCLSLKYVPSLEKLQALSRLVVSHSLIKQVPQGLEKILKLKWLDLSYNEELVMEPGFVDVLSNLTSMQYLDLSYCPQVRIKVEDVQGMDELECLGGTFVDCQNYNSYVEKLKVPSFGPKTYSLFLEKFPTERHFPDCWILPTHHRDLYICDNNRWNCLCEALSSEAPYSLSNLEVYNCKQLKNVFCLSDSCKLCTDICNLECLHLINLDSLTGICKENDVAVGRSLSNENFSCLRYFYISGCHKLKKLLTPWLVSQLPNLERITIKNCDSMEEVIAVGNRGSPFDFESELPNLKRLTLVCLPQLSTVCKRSKFGSSLAITITSCPKIQWNHPALP